ncbi:MAG TPA: hypothetical protein VHI77_07090 [Solirubrobacterales bacterium]|nr:hypothetical protein [Solirubrobacterales bacterium]
MFRQPCSHKPGLWPRQRSPENFTGVNVETGFFISKLGAKMGWRVIFPVHAGHDPVEFADSGHAPIVPRKPIRVVRTE